MKNYYELTIGLPVFNEARNIEKILNAILQQSFKNFEVIISDNNSSDNTYAIINKLINSDKRFRVYKQKENIGSHKNFQFVLDKSKTDYFMWLGADDYISKDFIKNNLNFLKKNQNYVGSTSKHTYDWDRKYSIYKDKKFVNFKVDDNLNKKIVIFLKNIDYSHSIFFSIFKTKILKSCHVIKNNFFAGDWAVMLFMLGQGKINRDLSSYIVFGTKGISYKKNSFKNIVNRKQPLFPLKKFNFFLIKFIITYKFSYSVIVYVIYWLIKKNYQYMKKKL